MCQFFSLGQERRRPIQTCRVVKPLQVDLVIDDYSECPLVPAQSKFCPGPEGRLGRAWTSRTSSRITEPISHQTNGLWPGPWSPKDAPAGFVTGNEILQLFKDLRGQHLECPRQALLAGEAQDLQDEPVGRKPPLMVLPKEPLGICCLWTPHDLPFLIFRTARSAASQAWSWRLPE